ncbi:MAG: Uma2 family endonuclease [Planctomycetes bacterium]|jgi:Uma2 family endonuclease|nr:Uma2 family endonuclease [Planctomycetota bacterium]
MTAALKWNLISVEDYLAGELDSPIKHEYVGGVVFAMAGARNLHNTIVINTLAAFHLRLRGKPCRPFNSDTKVRIQIGGQTRFYYPDVHVTCHPNRPTDSYQSQPKVIVEVLCKKTERLDKGEKKDAYLAIPSLDAYILIEQEMPFVAVFRRTAAGFVREVYEDMAAVVPLSEIEAEMPLAEIYEGVEFIPEPDEEE